MTTTPAHAAPWTLRRFIECLLNLTINRRQQSPEGILTGREAVARALYLESVQGSKLDMLNYDHDARLRGGWLAEADRRIAGGPKISTADADIAEWYGLTLTQWDGMSALAKVDKREGYAQARGLAS